MMSFYKNFENFGCSSNLACHFDTVLELAALKLVVILLSSVSQVLGLQDRHVSPCLTQI